MFEEKLIEQAGLTEGEAKVYLALLEIGSSTIGPIIERSKVARSFAYNILDKLIDKGLVSYVTHEKTKHYQAASPSRILDYIEKKKQQLDKDKAEIEKILPRLNLMQNISPRTEIAMYEGYKGLQTAFEHYSDKLKKGEEYVCWGGYPTQVDKYHNYWQKDHKIRVKKGITCRLLWDKDAEDFELRRRNAFWGSDTRRMHKKIKTPAWFMIYKDTVGIFLQENPDFRNTKTLVVEIVNQEIAQTFKDIFEEFWAKTIPYENEKDRL